MGVIFTIAFLSILSVLVDTSLSSPACGVRGPAARGAAQIVGGKTAGPLEFPWQISLHLIRLPNIDLGHICGGSIINKQFVDTAAHCIKDRYKSPSNYIVVVGEENLDVIDPYEEWIRVVNITIHPSWDPDFLNYDYALLKLARALDFAGRENFLMPICLPLDYWEFKDEKCIATGWGLTKDKSQGGTISPTLQKVELPIVDINTCARDYFNYNIVDRTTMICADPRRGGKSTCQGDSGGPLQCEFSEGVYALAGSTSWGATCAEAGKPSVFAKISEQIDWIHSVAGPTP